MKFMITFTWAPDQEDRAEGMARFQQTGGRPPAGVTLLGRWTRADLSGGWTLVEADDPQQLAAFAYGWSDLMELDITPVLEDQELLATIHTVTTSQP